MTNSEAMVRVEGLRKSYGTVEAVRGVSLDVQRGQVVVIIGPSGCGKSTLLRCLNLLEGAVGGNAAGERPQDRFRYRPDDPEKAAISRASAPASAWCSSSSTSSRT